MYYGIMVLRLRINMKDSLLSTKLDWMYRLIENPLSKTKYYDFVFIVMYLSIQLAHVKTKPNRTYKKW